MKIPSGITPVKYLNYSILRYVMANGDFPADLSKRPGIEGRQVKQGHQALKILYENFLPDYTPNDIKKTREEFIKNEPFKTHGNEAFVDSILAAGILPAFRIHSTSI